jgi:transcriptional regulator with XRE-family HTH domain
MRLSEWLEKHRLTQEVFAKMIAVHPVTVAKYASGRAVPRPDVAARIRKATRGAVSLDEIATHFAERREEDERLRASQASAASRSKRKAA